MKTVLILSTFPFKKQYHGGQHRLYELSKCYHTLGFNVVSMSIYDSSVYFPKEVNKTDIRFPKIETNKKYNPEGIPFIDDILTGYYAFDTESVFTKLSKILKDGVDLIHFEHPWMFKFAQKVKVQLGNKDTILVFGSANIEHRLKKSIFEQYHLLNSKTESIVQTIHELEKSAANGSDITLVVTEQDRQWFLKNTKVKNVIIVPNGVYINNTKKTVEELGYKLKRYVVFVGSAHPPNVDGFIKRVGDCLACFPPDTKLVVIGSMSDPIEKYLYDSRYSQINRTRVLFLGKTDQAVMEAFINGAFGIILPITIGEGSNLKTAEAINSGKYIVATSQSFRGFEKYKKLSGVFIADDIPGFRKSIQEVLLGNELIRTEDEVELAKELLWSSVTKVYKDFLKDKFNLKK